MATVKDIHREYIGAILKHDWDKVRSLFHPDYTYTGGDGKEMKGADAGLAIGQAYTTAFPDLKMDVKQLHTCGTTAIAEIQGSGTHRGDLQGIAPTGKKVSMVVCNVLDLKDGKIYREREYFDGASLLTQLGVLPAPAHA